MSTPKLIKGFKTFITKFPKAELPITLNQVTLSKFSLKNKPLSNELYVEFCSRDVEQMPDEYTEYVALFRLPEYEKGYAVVVWQGGLLEYYYQLLIFDKTGKLLTKNTIGGTKVVDETFEVVVARIMDTWTIEVKETVTNVEPSKLNDDAFKKTKSISLSADGNLSIPDSFLTSWQ